MNFEEKGAEMLLETFAEVNQATLRIAEILRAKLGQQQVVRGMDIRKYQGLPVAEAYVDAEATKGVGFSWWFEIERRNTTWKVEASIRRTDREGQDVVKEFPEQSVGSVTELQGVVQTTLSALVASAESFSFLQ